MFCLEGKMAKNSSRGRIRVFFAEVEGDDETIQEGLQAINVAANKIFQSNPRTIKVLSSTEVSQDESDLIELGDLEDEEEDVNPVVEKRNKSKPSTYKSPDMKFVKDLNLRPEGKTSWRDFYDQKKPNTQEHKITVAIFYLKNILEIDKLTPHHIFTCFKDVNARTPKHLPQAIRDIAKRKGWLDTSERGNIKITNHGENFVEHDLPPSKASNSK